MLTVLIVLLAWLALGAVVALALGATIRLRELRPTSRTLVAEVREQVRS